MNSKIETTPKISVIIPLYNHERFICQAAESVLNQTYQNIELIIINDGSKDSSWECIEQYDDPRVIKVNQENQGAHNTINRGLAMATGEYLAILNSDDVFYLDRFEVFMDYFQKNAEVDFLCSYIELINGENQHLGVKEGWYNCEPWPVDRWDLSYKCQDDFYTMLIMSNFVSTTSNMIFKRAVYEKIGGMRNLRFAHDWDFMLRLASEFHCEIIKKPLMQYRLHGNNTINTNRKWLLFEICFVLAANIDRFYSNHIYTRFEKEDIIKQTSMLFHSTNLQGNDKVFWMIRTYIEAFRKNGEAEPELMLLDDKELLDYFISLVTDLEEGQPAPPEPIPPSFPRARRIVKKMLGRK